MQEQFIAVNSITYAHKASDYLRSRNIKASIVRTPREISNTGCGYSLQVNGDINMIVNILGEAGINVMAIY